MRVLCITSEERARKFFDLSSLPGEIEPVFVGSFPETEVALAAGKDAECIMADAMSVVGADIIEGMPNLKLIQSEGVGYQGIDIEAAKARGIAVCNCPGVNAGAVAEQAILLMLACLRRFLEGYRLVREGKQIEAKEQYILDGLPELGALKVGLIGFGAIGKETAKRLGAFGADVRYFARHRAAPEVEEETGAVFEERESLLRTSDIVSLHIASTPETFEYMDANLIGMMKQGAILINTARGEIVDQQALVSAIVTGKLSAVGLDTLFPEPVRTDNPLLNVPPEFTERVILSPHIGGVTIQCFKRAHKIVWDNITACLTGEPLRHRVD